MTLRIVRQLVFICLSFIASVSLLAESGCDRQSDDILATVCGPWLTVAPASLNIAVGNLGDATALLAGQAGMDHSLTWAVRDTSIAQITHSDANRATVVGRSVGTTVLIATAVADPGLKAAAIVVVQ